MLRAPLGAKRGRNVAHHRYINFSIGIDTAPGGGKTGGVKDKPTPEERARVLAKAKKKIENMNLDGYVVTEVKDDLPPGIAKDRS